MRALLGAGRRDESGDFTAGAGLRRGAGGGDPRLHGGARRTDGAATCARLRELVGALARPGSKGCEELETIAELLAGARARRR